MLSEIERFWSKVLITDTCWEWTAALFTQRRNYGRVRFRGKNDQRAHRVAYELLYGPIPKGDGFHGTCVLHECDNPKCVRPSHLKLGTQLENMDEMHRKGRQSPPPRFLGESNKRAVLNEDAIRSIRSSEDNVSALSHQYGVSKTTIRNIQKRLAWRHVQ